MISTAPHHRFREARERRGLETFDLAFETGVSDLQVCDIENSEGNLTACYSPRKVRRFCQVLGIRPVELFADNITESPVYADELVERIHTECRSRGVTLEQFEDVVGWRLSACIEPPERLLEDMTIDGLQWLCRELRIDWQRVLLDL